MTTHHWTEPRLLHAGAWWVWALGLAAAASQTTNPVVLVLFITVAALVVTVRGSTSPTLGSFRAFLLLGCTVVALRLAVTLVFGTPVPGGTTLVTLPEVTLPDWAAGVRIGGSVSVEGLVLATYQGLQLVAVLAAIGAANALADARRLLRSLPGALYEVGVAVVVALTFAPRLVSDTVRVRRAQRLRGRDASGVRGFRRVAPPVLEGALDSSLELAAAMDARGFGRRAVVPPRWRRTSAVLVLTGLLGILGGVYGLMAGSTTPVTGTLALAVGCVAAIGGVLAAGRHSARTRYRPDPWDGPEWLVAASGLLSATLMAWAAARPFPGIDMLLVPLVWPTLPWVAIVAGGLAAAPALLAPAVPPTLDAISPRHRATAGAGAR